MWIPAALDELSITLNEKNHDYKVNTEFSNFEFAAAISGVNPGDVMLTQIGIKLGRLKGLADGKNPKNEAVYDTIKDLAGYAVILYAYTMYLEALKEESE